MVRTGERRFATASLQRMWASDERGAAFAIVALALFALLVSGALAVDLSALERRGQVLQSSVDAAALAGVTAWADSGDSDVATQVVTDVLRQNGMELDADLAVDLRFLSRAEIEVTLTDRAPTVLLGGVAGFGGELERTATARHEICAVGCFRSLEVGAPFGSVLSNGDGDGFVPVSIGDRSYAVNHKASTLECVDRSTGAQCWPSQELFSTTVRTSQMPHAEALGDRVYYVGWDGPIDIKPLGDGWLRVGCWNATTDARCVNEAALFNAGDGVLHQHDGALYVFSGDRNVYCLEAVTLVECSEYAGGRPTALASEPGWGGITDARAANGDRVGHGDRVWVTLANRGQVWMHCWDFAATAPCPGFSPQLLHNTQVGSGHDYMNGRLFFHRDIVGEPTAVCSYGDRVRVECYDLDNAARVGAAEAALATTINSIELTFESFIGVTTWHPASNRQFFVSTFDRSTTYCYDFETAASCGELFNDSPFGAAATYGYEALGNCMIGYGDRSIFFTLEPDLSSSCNDGASAIDIEPCTCSGEPVWPPVGLGDTEGVAVFEVRVLGPAGDPLLPVDGSWVELTGTALSLDGIDTSLDHLTVEARVTAAQYQNPWADGVPPSLIIGRNSSDPRLTN